MTASASFKDQNREFGEMVRKLSFVRVHNLKIKEAHGRWVPGYLLFAEGLLVLIGLERFRRVVLGGKASEGDTLPNLREKATSRIDLLALPPWRTREQTIRAMLMHGNCEQAAKQSGNKDLFDYFGSSAYINIGSSTGSPRRSIPRPASHGILDSRGHSRVRFNPLASSRLRSQPTNRT